MKRVALLCMIFTICFTTLFSSVAFADNTKVEYPFSIATGAEAQPLTEQTEWYYRIYNGNIEKRLWSITYGKWLTDWIYVGPAP